MAPTMAERFEFGPFLLDIPNSQLLREGVPVKLRPQTFLVLRALVHNTGQWVSREKLIREALAELERAAEENSAAQYILDVAPRMDSLRPEKRFSKVQFKLNQRY